MRLQSYLRCVKESLLPLCREYPSVLRAGAFHQWNVLVHCRMSGSRCGSPRRRLLQCSKPWRSRPVAFLGVSSSIENLGSARGVVQRQNSSTAWTTDGVSCGESGASGSCLFVGERVDTVHGQSCVFGANSVRWITLRLTLVDIMQITLVQQIRGLRCYGRWWRWRSDGRRLFQQFRDLRHD